MKSTIALLLALTLLGCAQPPVASSPPPPPLPSAVTNPPPASTEGSLSTSLQGGLQETLQDFQCSLQEYLNESILDLLESLERARKSPPPPGPAPSGPSA